jgi:hypothetical protein
LRKYEVAHLTPSGEIKEFSRRAPCLPAFEDAFAAIARGGLVMTETGPVAVEDLQPGMMIQTVDAGLQTLLWKGSTTLMPHAVAPDQSEDMGTLTRVAADGLGFNRPMKDLMLGPKARMLARHRSKGAVLAPITALENGETIFSITPFAPVRLYHLAFRSQQILRVSGLEIESYHPGRDFRMSLSHEMLALFLELFPHCASLEDFGTQCLPRVDTQEAREQTLAGYAS